MHNYLISLSILVSFTITGCSQAIRFDKQGKLDNHQPIVNTDFEYIGIKPTLPLLPDSEGFILQQGVEDYISKKIKELGVNNNSQLWLHRSGMLEKKNDFFVDGYTHDQLNKYPSQNKFILFGELLQCNISLHSDLISSNTSGVGVGLTSTIFLAPIGIPMMMYGGSQSSDTAVSIKYKLFIYNKEKKSIIWHDKVEIIDSDEYFGSLKKENIDDILEYYSIQAVNNILSSFEKGIKSAL